MSCPSLVPIILDSSRCLPACAGWKQPSALPQGWPVSAFEEREDQVGRYDADVVGSRTY